MAKHVSTTGPRATASAKTAPSKPRATGTGVSALKATMLASVAALGARTVTHGTVFRGLDLIDIALSDVAATAAVLDEIIANMDDGDAKHDAIDTTFRHLLRDLTTLQNANKEARTLILRAPKVGCAA
jgi:hypothetical protein